MIPITRPEGYDIEYYYKSLTENILSAKNTDTNNEDSDLKEFDTIDVLHKERHYYHCIYLCVDYELKMLQGAIDSLRDGEGEFVTRLTRLINTGDNPILIPNLYEKTTVEEKPVYLNDYNKDLAKCGPGNIHIIDNYLHYSIIKKNLGLEGEKLERKIHQSLTVADLPYAISAMQKTKTRFGEEKKYIVFNQKEETKLSGEKAVNIYFDANEIQAFINKIYKISTGIADKAPVQYSKATANLIENLGPYCSYCGINIKTGPHTEHILPKGETGDGIGFSSHSKSWLNFLPACVSCNSSKGSHPHKNDMQEAGAAAFKDKDDEFNRDDNTKIEYAKLTPDQITDNEYARLVLDLYQLPLEGNQDNNSYKNLGFSIQKSEIKKPTATGQLKLNWEEYQGDYGNVRNWKKEKNNEKNKFIIINNGGEKLNIRVLVGPVNKIGSDASLSDTEKKKVLSIIGTCSINGSPKARADRRTIERTDTFLIAIRSLENLKSQIQLILTGTADGSENETIQIIYNIWKEQTALTIKEKGFLALWLKIFKWAYPGNHPLTEAGIDKKFPEPITEEHEVAGAEANKQITLAQDMAMHLKANNYFPNTQWKLVP